MTTTLQVGDLWESKVGHQFEITEIARGVATLEPRNAGAYWHRWPVKLGLKGWTLLQRDGMPVAADGGGDG